MSDTEISLTSPSGKNITFSTGLFINNEFVKGSSSETMPAVDPATGETICSVEIATDSDVDAAVQAARDAFNNPQWRDMTPEGRATLLHRFADLVDANREELFTIQSWDCGKPYQATVTGEGDFFLGCIRYYAGWADKLHGKTLPVNSDKFAYTLKQPLGVCLSIAPWNYPLTNTSWKLGPALATGNCIIMKPSEYSPLSALYLAKLFKEAGYPPGVVQVLNGYGNSTGAALASHPGVDKVAFTGSTFTGQKIIKASAATMKRVTIEAGGKSAFIVFGDADLEQAAKWAIAGGLGNSGQICNANSRILVQSSVHDKFVEIVSKLAQETKFGAPFDKDTTHGPQTSKMQYDKIMGYIKGAKEEGANLVTGGGRPDGVNDGGFFVQPTIFTKVTNKMTIFREEVFGPVMSVTTFETEDDAVTLANDSAYGLAAMVFTENLKAAHRTAARLQAGTVWINESNDTDWKLPFGGPKMSGSGKELGENGLEGYLEEKVIHVNLGLEM